MNVKYLIKFPTGSLQEKEMIPEMNTKLPEVIESKRDSKYLVVNGWILIVNNICFLKIYSIEILDNNEIKDERR